MDEQDTTQQPDEQAPVMHPLFADILREFGLPVAPAIRLATTTGGETHD